MTSAEVARALGLSVRLIQKYRADGLLTPAMETPKGHARWDLDEVKRQLDELRRRHSRDSGT